YKDHHCPTCPSSIKRKAIGQPASLVAPANIKTAQCCDAQ
ncbi:hypothetical protein RRG08_028169, partial [Elysia crispata]